MDLDFFDALQESGVDHALERLVGVVGPKKAEQKEMM